MRLITGPALPLVQTEDMAGPTTSIHNSFC